MFSKRSHKDGPPVVQVIYQPEGDPRASWRFNEAFRIGREKQCDIHIDAGLVSRVHLNVTYDAGSWWIEDPGSSNGTYLNGEKIQREQLQNEITLELGRGGPLLHFKVETGTQDEQHVRTVVPVTQIQKQTRARRTPPPAAKPPSPPKPASARSSKTPASVDSYIGRYFDPSDQQGPAGEHTMMIRQAYASVRKKHSRKYLWVIGAVVSLFVIAASIAAYQTWKNNKLEKLAFDLFIEMRNQDIENAKLILRLDSLGQDISEHFNMSGRRQRMEGQYQLYIEELGIRRRPTPQEEVIFQMAYIFNETEFNIPATFLREVREGIKFWQNEGRSGLITSLRRAEDQGMTPYIVQTMKKYGLPPQFFYLALQESAFNLRAVGPATRYGIAKGMWQFIPSTAEVYGLSVGPLKDLRQYDQQDERHDFELSTDAAARYLLKIYGTLAQASGLLVMASYNWGEYGVASKLERLFEGIPENATQRSYWRFYEEYSQRMPHETKDYVRKIFAAAVICENPRLFGFDFDNPLKAYLAEPASQP